MLDDQDDIINSILNEETGLDLDYNKDKYKVNDILNEDTDKLLLNQESHETKEQPKDNNINELNESEKKAKDIPIETKKEEKPIETKKEIIKETPNYIPNENDDLLDAILNEPSNSIEIKKEEKKEEKKIEEKKEEIKKEEKKVEEVKKEEKK